MYEELWSSRNGTTSWIDNVPDEQRQWLEGLADVIIEKGSEPTWTHVGRMFRSRFGLDRPVDSTLAESVRKLVKQRG